MAGIFVSYARKDIELVKQIMSELHNLGFDYWMDARNLQGGERWTEEIADAILKCEHFLLFISTPSMESDNVAREVQIAYENHKKIILLRLDKVEIPKSLKYQLAGLQWTEYSASDWKSRLAIALDHVTVFPHPQKSEELKSEFSSGVVDEQEASPNEVVKNSLNHYHKEFSEKSSYISEFETKVNQSVSNLNILIKAQEEFNSLEDLSETFLQEPIIFDQKPDYPKHDLERMKELAGSIAAQAQSAAGSVANNANAEPQINQIKRNLPVLRRILKQLLLWLEQISTMPS